MRKALKATAMVVVVMLLSPAALFAQTDDAPSNGETAEQVADADAGVDTDEAAPDEAAPDEAAPEPTQENTVDACQDGEDNDLDQHIDCDDQDCEIFAVCIEAPEEETPPPPMQVVLPERGWQCRDGRDNDNNGSVDCHDKSCQYSRYCRRVMYERPEPKNKAPGVFISFGFGIALPNFRMPTAETEIPSYHGPGNEEVPFDPDIGLMLDLQVGYLFLKFLGAGLNLKSAFTFATNRDPYFDDDDDPDDFKYTGSKYYGNVGGNQICASFTLRRNFR